MRRPGGNDICVYEGILCPGIALLEAVKVYCVHRMTEKVRAHYILELPW
jgi:hypothetical protein